MRRAIPGQRATMPPQMMLTASNPKVPRKNGDSQTAHVAKCSIDPRSSGIDVPIRCGKVDWASVARSTQPIVVPINQRPTRTEVKNHQTRSRTALRGRVARAVGTPGVVVRGIVQTPLFASLHAAPTVCMIAQRAGACRGFAQSLSPSPHGRGDSCEML